MNKTLATVIWIVILFAGAFGKSYVPADYVYIFGFTFGCLSMPFCRFALFGNV